MLQNYIIIRSAIFTFSNLIPPKNIVCLHMFLVNTREWPLPPWGSTCCHGRLTVLKLWYDTYVATFHIIILLYYIIIYLILTHSKIKSPFWEHLCSQNFVGKMVGRKENYEEHYYVGQLHVVRCELNNVLARKYTRPCTCHVKMVILRQCMGRTKYYTNLSN